jgi:hypothetical protein
LKYISLPVPLGVVGSEREMRFQLECLLDGQPQKAWTMGEIPPVQ